MSSIPLFTHREVLRFLVGEFRHIEAASEDECWRAAWRRFFPCADALRTDGPLLKFTNICRVYGFQPHPIAGGRWRIQNVNLVA